MRRAANEGQQHRRPLRRQRELGAALLAVLLVAGACGSRRNVHDIAIGSVLSAGDLTAAGSDGSIAGGSAERDGAPLAGAGTAEELGGGIEGGRDATSYAGTAGGVTGSGGPSPTRGSEEVVVASVGNYSGIPGAVYAEAGAAVQAWAKAVNAQGGLAGRSVRALVLDDGGDPARHSALVKHAVEEQGVVAFIASFAPLTGAASVDYLNERRVPTIGGQGSDPWFVTSAVHFPTIAAGNRYHYANVAATVVAAKAAGLSKFGVIGCVEATSCKEAIPIWEKYATELGMDVVYSGSASIAQPDFTSECLNARNRGVEVFMLALDGASARRLAGSCARQDYRPRFMQPGEGFEQVMLSDPNLDGLITGSAVYPILLGGGGAVAQKARVDIGTYMGKVDNFLLVGQAWLSAMVFGKAVGSIEGEITGERVIEGLGHINGEDFGGLGAPINYDAGAKSNQISVCYFVVAIKAARFVMPDNGARHCV